MNVVGVKVKHGAFGSGTVKWCDGQIMAVKFEEGIKQFLYPSVFGKFLQAEDEEIQKTLLAEIARAKEKSEQEDQANGT